MSLPEPFYDLADHPEHAKLLGEIIVRWSFAEYQLCGLFAALLRAPPWHAQTAYFSIVNNDARLDLIRALNNEMAGDKATRKQIEGFVERARQCARKRNMYAHRNWVKHEGHPYIIERIGEVFPHGEKRKVKTDEMVAARDEIGAFITTLTEFLRAYTIARPLFVLRNENAPPSWRKKR